MRLIMVVVLLGLVVANQPQGIFTSEVEQQLKSTHLGKVFLKLVTLKSKAQQFDFSRLFEALEELSTSIQERKTEENTAFQKDNVQHFTDVQFYSTQITQFENEIATHQIDITDFTEVRDGLQKALEGKKDELKENNSLKAKLEKSIAADEKTFKEQQSQYGNAIQAIDQALELVGSQRDGAFIQRTDKTAVHLETALEKLQHRRIMFKPLIKAFSQMLQPSFNDQSASAKVQQLLQNLRDSLVKSKTELENQYAAQKAASDHLLGDYNQRTSNLNDIIIPTIAAEIQTKDGQLQTKNQLLKDAQNNLSAAQSNLENSNNRWIQRQSENSKLIDEYDSQLALFPKIQRELEGAGIRKNK